MDVFSRKCLAVLVMVAVTMAPQSGLTAVPAAGSEPLSLPPLLAEVRRANPELLAARKRWEAAQAKVPQATGLPPPTIGVEWEDIPRGTFKINQATVMYQLIQSLPFPGKLSARRRVALAEAQQVAAVFKQAEWDVLTRTKSTFYDLYLIDREEEIVQEQLGWLKPLVAAAQARYSTGAAPETEFLQAQAEFLEASNQLVVLANRREAMAAHLNHLLDRRGHTSAGRPGALALQSVPSSPDELLAVALAAQPDLLVMQYAAERADASWRLAKRELWPDLQTMVELRDPAMGPIGPWDLSLALVLPFWFWPKQRYGVRAALADKESMAAAYQAMRGEVERRIHEQWHEASAAYATAALAQQRLIPLARQAVTSAMAAYQGGQGSFMMVAEALRQLAQRERMYEEQLVMVEQRVAMLEDAVGVPLRSAHVPAAGGQS